MKIIMLPGVKTPPIKYNKPFSLVWPIIFGLIAYYLLHSNYNLFYVDDSWTISNTWNLVNKGIASDLVFIDADKLGHQQFFGFTYHYIMGTILNVFGWTKSNAFFVNTIFIFLATYCWWHILRALPFAKTVIRMTVVFLPLFPPFFFAAHSGRIDALIILLISLQFLSFIKKKYLLAAFLLGVAIEVHPMGAIGAFYMLAYAIANRKEMLFNKYQFFRIAAYSFAGISLGFCYYLALHWNHFNGMEIFQLVTTKSDMSTPVNNYILNYFTKLDWLNHLWEFIALATALVIYIKKKLYKKNEFLLILLVVLVVSTFITRRENSNYFAFIFPAFMLLYFYTFEQIGHLKNFALVVFCSLILNYGLKYYSRYDFDFQEITQNIHSELKNKSYPVIGMPDIWFAAFDRTFIPIHYHRNFNKLDLDHFYFVETDYLQGQNRIYSDLKIHLLDNYNCKKLKTIPAYQEEEVRICECSNSKKQPIPLFTKREYPGWKHVVNEYFNVGLF